MAFACCKLPNNLHIGSKINASCLMPSMRSWRGFVSSGRESTKLSRIITNDSKVMAWSWMKSGQCFQEQAWWVRLH